MKGLIHRLQLDMNKNSQYPHVSVITPAFNSCKTIAETIQSVANQDYPYIEHIIVDGGSTDGTINHLADYSHLKWISEPDNGQSDALNKGFTRASGDILGWLNADDTYNPGAVRSAVDFLIKNPHVGMVYSNCNHIDEQGQVLFCQHVSPFSIAQQLLDFQIPQPTVFFRKEMIDQVGNLDTRLHYVMDWAWFLRMGCLYPIGYVDETWANFRVWGDTKTTRHPEKFWQEIIAFFDEFFNYPGVPDEAKTIRQQAYARANWTLGCIYYSILSGKGIEVADKGNLTKALEYYPLLRDDQNYAIDQIVHWAVSQTKTMQVEDYVERLFEELIMVDAKNRKLKKKVLGHIYATLFLTKTKGIKFSDDDKKLILEWFQQAILNDPSWLSNRGMLSGVFAIIKQGKA